MIKLISAPEFVKNIDTNNLIGMLMNHFDQVMTLYNIIGRRDDIDVMVDNNNEKITNCKESVNFFGSIVISRCSTARCPAGRAASRRGAIR